MGPALQPVEYKIKFDSLARLTACIYSLLAIVISSSVFEVVLPVMDMSPKEHYMVSLNLPVLPPALLRVES